MGRFYYPCPLCGQQQQTRQETQVGLPCPAHSREEAADWFEAHGDKEKAKALRAEEKEAKKIQGKEAESAEALHSVRSDKR